VLNPVKIAAISRGGLVDVRFYQDVLVPNFTHPPIQPGIKRQLEQESRLITPEKYITKDVLSVQLQTKFTTQEVDWECTEFSNQSIKLKLNFTDPMEISQNHQDKLLVRFV
jgi:hypothetical protein